MSPAVTLLYARGIAQYMDAHPDLVAPCGMNCAVCSRYLKGQRDQKDTGCSGCIPRGQGCTYYRGLCRALRDQTIRFCHQCSDFPCERLEKLDARYQKRYDTSLIDNLRRIQHDGIDPFLQEEKERWRCPQCGGTVSIHTSICIDCACQV